MTKNEILNILEKAKDKNGEIPMRLVRQAFEKLPEPCEDAVSRKAVLSMIDTYMNKSVELHYLPTSDGIKKLISILPSAQPERKTGHWILNRSGQYCCSKCMEPCASYVMMKPRDEFCKMCGNRNEVME